MQRQKSGLYEVMSLRRPLQARTWSNNDCEIVRDGFALLPRRMGPAGMRSFPSCGLQDVEFFFGENYSCNNSFPLSRNLSTPCCFNFTKVAGHGERHSEQEQLHTACSDAADKLATATAGSVKHMLLPTSTSSTPSWCELSKSCISTSWT